MHLINIANQLNIASQNVLYLEKSHKYWITQDYWTEILLRERAELWFKGQEWQLDTD
ncbi:MAG: hypothetical protein ABJI60_07540 [Kangiellaceae bacterium]